MPTYGLSATGFLIPTLNELRTSINLDLINAFGASIDVNTGILARFIGILCERLSLLWEKLEAVYNTQSPDTATGFALDAINLLRGSTRDEATYSTVTLWLLGVPATIVPAGQQVATTSNFGVNKFLTGASGTLSAVPTWVTHTTYAAGNLTTDGTSVWLCMAPGFSGNTPGSPDGIAAPTEVVGQVIVDGSDGVLSWMLLGEGTAATTVPGQAVLTGPIVGAALDITTIDQPVNGWRAVINTVDALSGSNDQMDEAFRTKSEAELSQVGTSTPDAIRAALREIPGVTAATVFVNNTDVTDVDGVTPHTVEALVSGGTDAVIGATLLQQIAAGINTVGNVTTTPLDSQGVAQTIKFSRPVAYDIGVTLALTKAPNNPNDPANTYPLDGDAQVVAAIIAFGQAQKAGKNVVASAIAAQAFKVPGVLDVTVALISSALAPTPPPTPSVSTTIQISTRQLAVFATPWISVTSTDGTP